MNTLFDKETFDALQQLCEETCEAMQLAKKIMKTEPPKARSTTR